MSADFLSVLAMPSWRGCKQGKENNEFLKPGKMLSDYLFCYVCFLTSRTLIKVGTLSVKKKKKKRVANDVEEGEGFEIRASLIKSKVR